MRSTRSRSLRICLALAITVSAVSLLLDLDGSTVALLDFAPFLALLCLTLIWPEATSRLLEKVVAKVPRRLRAKRHEAHSHPLRAEGDSGRLLVAQHGARGPPLGLAPAVA